jgi:hypothetical protein
MKTLLLIAAGLMSYQAWAQEGTDYMGMPVENVSPVVNEIGTPKSLQAEFIQTQMVFPSPTNLPSSIAYYDDVLWVIGYNAYVVYKVSPIDGSVLGTIPIAIQKPYGITFKNNEMYILDNNAKDIIIYTLEGVVTDTIDLASFYNPLYVTGLCAANGELWFNDTKGPNPSSSNDSIYSLSSLLELNNRFEDVGTFPSGIGFDGKYLWVNDNPSQTTNMLDPITHNVLKSIHTPGGMYPNGVASDNVGLWIINNFSDSIYYLIPDSATNIAYNSIDNKGIKVFSNNDQIVFNYQREWEGSEMVIFDCTSRIIDKQFIPAGGEFVWNNSKGINSGIYFVSVYNKENKFSEKVFLNKN